MYMYVYIQITSFCTSDNPELFGNLVPYVSDYSLARNFKNASKIKIGRHFVFSI